MTSSHYTALQAASLQLEEELNAVTLTTPAVGYVYNYLSYAREPFEDYLARYLPVSSPIEALFLGMNPGPWGTAQNGVPFGDMAHVTGWLGVHGEVGEPAHMSPKRPVKGFASTRREISGERLWGWIKARWKEPGAFFASHFIWSHCPLMFIHENGSRNITPDRLVAIDREAIYPPCDAMLRTLIDTLEPRHIVGIGNYATARARACIEDTAHRPGVIKILHPSPASPAANEDWRGRTERTLAQGGFAFADAPASQDNGTSFGDHS